MIRWALNPLISVLIKERQEGETQRREGGNVSKEAEVGVMWPQGQKCLEPSEAGRDEIQTFPESLPRESTVLLVS